MKKELRIKEFDLNKYDKNGWSKEPKDSQDRVVYVISDNALLKRLDALIDVLEDIKLIINKGTE